MLSVKWPPAAKRGGGARISRNPFSPPRSSASLVRVLTLEPALPLLLRREGGESERALATVQRSAISAQHILSDYLR